jgi:hypothetical protein
LTIVAEPRRLLCSDGSLLYLLMTANIVSDQQSSSSSSTSANDNVDSKQSNNNDDANQSSRVVRDVLIAYDLSNSQPKPVNTSKDNDDDNDDANIAIKPKWHCILEDKTVAGSSVDRHRKFFCRLLSTYTSKR